VQATDKLADLRSLDDPAFIAERARVRAELEHVPLGALERADLELLYGRVMDELDRRLMAGSR
jgi:hypothetical protein